MVQAMGTNIPFAGVKLYVTFTSTPNSKIHFSCKFKLHGNLTFEFIEHVNLNLTAVNLTLTVFRVSLFRAVHRWGWRQKDLPLLKICHIYPTIMKLATFIPYLYTIQKNINHVTHLLGFADTSDFFIENHHFLLDQKLQIYIGL